MSFGYDPDAVIQEADIEMAELEEQAAQAARLRKRGVCTHGWMLGRGGMNRSRAEIEDDRKLGHFPDRPTAPSIQCQNDIPNGECLCLDCGELVDDPFDGRD